MSYLCTQMDNWDKLEHPFPYGFKLFWVSTHDLAERQMDMQHLIAFKMRFS